MITGTVQRRSASLRSAYNYTLRGGFLTMSEKIAKTGIKRDNNLLYFIRKGEVWTAPRKKPGEPKGKQVKVASPGIELDYSKYLYFVDADGDVARNARQVGGSKRKKTAKAAPKKAAAKKAAPKKAAAKKPAAKKAAPKKAAPKKAAAKKPAAKKAAAKKPAAKKKK